MNVIKYCFRNGQITPDKSLHHYTVMWCDTVGEICVHCVAVLKIGLGCKGRQL